jgi:hypothetical protein
MGPSFFSSLLPPVPYSNPSFRGIPFVYEIRVLLDWTITKTTLTLYEWLKFEDIFSELFLVKCRIVVEENEGRAIGAPQKTWYVALFSLPSTLFSLPSSLFPLPSSLFPLPSSLFPLPFSLFPLPSSLFLLPSSLFPPSLLLAPSPSHLPSLIPVRYKILAGGGIVFLIVVLLWGTLLPFMSGTSFGTPNKIEGVRQDEEGWREKSEKTRVQKKKSEILWKFLKIYKPLGEPQIQC